LVAYRGHRVLRWYCLMALHKYSLNLGYLLYHCMYVLNPFLMKSPRRNQLVALITVVALTGCTNNDGANNKTEMSIRKEQPTEPKETDIEAEFLGNYHGVQPSYFMKNQYGSDMVIAGDKVPVPSIDYIFLVKENNVVSLQQTNLEDGSRVYYDGTFKVIQKDNQVVKMECNLSDGEYSNPTYILSINPSSKNGTCSGSNEPVFNVEKQNR
jgi:hypothetical protein